MNHIKKGHKALAWILSILLVITLIPELGYAAESEGEAAPAKEALLAPEEVTKEDVVETTETTTTYDLGNQHKMTVFHGGEVRYGSDRGTLFDYDPSLIRVKEGETTGQDHALAGYLYENRQGDKKHYLPKNLSEDTPARMENGDYAIELSLTKQSLAKLGAGGMAKLEKETVQTAYEEEKELPVKAVYGGKDAAATLTYTSGEAGLKETITLKEKPETNVFQYKLKLTNLTARKNVTDGGITYYDKKTGDIAGCMEAPWMNDASGNAYSEAIQYELKEEAGSDGAYLLTMTVDEAYLSDKERQYPVTIDPSNTWKGNDELKDVYVISGSTYGNTNFYESGTKKMPVGKNSTGTHRTYIKFINLKATVGGKYVDSAKLTVYETGTGASKQKIGVHRVTESWSVSSLTHNNRATAASTAYDTITTKKTANSAHTFDLTKFARNVASGAITNYGVMLKNSTSSPDYACFTGSRASSATYRPKLVVTYYDGPATATSVKVSNAYLNAGKSLTVSWAGITSKSLARVEYRIAKCDSAGTVTNENYVAYKTLKTTTASSGSATIAASTVTGWAAGRYRIYVRGVDNGGIKGTGKSATFYIDRTAPVAGNLVLKDNSDAVITGAWTTEKNPKICFSGVNDTYISTSSITYGIAKSGGTPTYKAVSELSLSSSSKPYAGYFRLNAQDQELETGEYTIYMKVTDSAGNTVVKSAAYKRDVSKPTGSISVTEQGTGKEITTLKDTVNIKAVVSDAGSDINTADMKLYRLKSESEEDGKESLVEEMPAVKTIFDNATISTNRDLDTNLSSDDLDNGDYRLKLYIKDNVGHETTITKDVRIENPIPAPKITVSHGKESPLQVSWNFTSGINLKKLQYKLPGDDTWDSVPNSDKLTGVFVLSIPRGEGAYDVKFRGVDSFGVNGIETTEKCIIDCMPPIVKINSFYQGTLKGTVADTNLNNWCVSYKEQGAADSTYQILFEGDGQRDDERLGFLDLSKLNAEKDYVMRLEAFDIAGNYASDTCEIYVPNDENIAKEYPASFAIKRPVWAEYSDNEFVLKTNTKKLELKIPEGYTLVGQSSTWYINNQKVGTDAEYEDDFSTLPKGGSPAKYKEQQAYRIFVINKDSENRRTYSRAVTRNGILRHVTFDGTAENGSTSKEIQLDQDAVSFRMNAKDVTLDGKDLQYAVRIGEGAYQDIEAGRTYYISDLNSDMAYTDQLQVKATATGAADTLNIGKTQFNFDTVEKESFRLSKMDNYIPDSVAVKDKINYKTYLYWDNRITDDDADKQISYEVYRGTSKDFVPSKDTLAASNIRAGYFTEINVNYGGTFYYRIRAVKKDEDGKILDASSYSKCVGSTVISGNEYTKRMGMKDYWKYAQIDTPNGTAAVEKSAGNLVYQQKDAEIPNEQLEVEITRSYNSSSTAKSAFGLGWTHDFDMELLSICETDSVDFDNVVLKDGSGTIYHFLKQEDGNYVSSLGKYIIMKDEEKSEDIKLPEKKIGVASANQMKTVTVSSQYTLTTKDNIEYRFNSGGQMVYQGEPNGNFLLFEYDDKIGLLKRVVTSKNIAIDFDYTSDDYRADELLVKQMRLPDGCVTKYEYKDAEDSANYLLSKVTETAENGDTISYEYQYTNDQLTQIKDAEGNAYTVNYDGAKAVSVTYPDGEMVKLNFHGDNSTTTEKWADGNMVSQETDYFNYYGNCVRSIDNEAYETTYSYKNNLLHETVSQVDGRYVDDNGYVRHPLKPQTKTETIDYDEEDNPTQEMEEDGTTTDYTYCGDDAGEVNDDLVESEKEVDGEGNTVMNESYKYDDHGNVKESYDSVSKTLIRTTYFEKDDPEKGEVKGEVKKEEEFAVQEDGSEKLQSTTTYEYKYDGDGNKTETVLQTIDGNQIKNITDTDVMGREIREEDRGKIDIHVYDGFGRLIRTQSSETGDDGKTISSSVSSEYNKNGSLIKEVDEEGLETHYTYDKMNRVIEQKQVKNGELLKLEKTEYGYETVQIHTGNGTKLVEHAFVTTVKNMDPEKHLIPTAISEEKTYQDAMGRTIREYKNGIYTDMTYDGQGNMITLYEIGETAKSEDEGMLTIFLYDASGNETATIQNPVYVASEQTFQADDNSILEKKEYDSNGNVVKEINGKGETTQFNYDAEGNLTAVILPDGSKTTYAYDVEQEDGTTATITTDPLGQQSVVKTDNGDREVEVSDLGNGGSQTPITTIFAYDKKDNKIKETDSEGNYKTFTYDGRDRLTSIRYFDKNKIETLRTAYTYDLTDNITSMADYKVNGETASLYRYTKYRYDKQKRLIGFAECNGSNALTSDGKENEAVIQNNLLTFTYDANDNLTAINYPDTGSEVIGITFQYNPKTQWLEYVYARTKNLGEKRLVRSYTYTSDNKVASMTDYRGFTGEDSGYTMRTYTYDSFDRPIKIEYYDSSDLENPKESYTYEFDQNNNITKETLKNEYPEEGFKVDETREYTFDLLDQLVQTDITDRANDKTETIVYTYDKAGNRLSEESNDTETQYTYNSLNQMLTGTETSKADESVTSDKTYTYDKNGNQTKEEDSKTGESKQMTYDADNRLATYTAKKDGAVTLTQSNVYNGEGKRIRKTETDSKDTKTVHYFYQNDAVLYTADDEANTTAFNVMGAEDNVIATARSAGTDQERYYFYNKDVRESTTNLLDTQGSSVISYKYSDYGETTINGDAAFYNEICYTGGIYDRSTELYYLNARFYDPEDATFLTQDTYRGEDTDPGSHNLYTYCANNPVTYSDPSGHFPIWAAIGAAHGAYNGYKYAKRKKLRGWRRAGAIVGGAALGAVNPFKRIGRAYKAAKRVARIIRKPRVAKKVYRSVRKAVKPSRIKRQARRVKIKTVHAAKRARCTVTRKGCFVAGTPISVKDGFVPIETIKEGDRVWSEDTRTGAKGLKKVKKIFVREKDSIIRLTINGEVTQTTEEHPFFVKDIGWIPAGELKTGDLVKLQSDTYVPIEECEVAVLDEPIKVYNFEVEDYHTYYVSSSKVLVHNKYQNKGRGGKQKRLRELADDDKISSALRGEIKRDINEIKRGKRKTIRVPQGYHLAHRRGKEAAKGFSYKESDLQDINAHKRQHRLERVIAKLKKNRKKGR